MPQTCATGGAGRREGRGPAQGGARGPQNDPQMGPREAPGSPREALEGPQRGPRRAPTEPQKPHCTNGGPLGCRGGFLIGGYGYISEDYHGPPRTRLAADYM